MAIKEVNMADALYRQLTAEAQDMTIREQNLKQEPIPKQEGLSQDVLRKVTEEEPLLPGPEAKMPEQEDILKAVKELNGYLRTIDERFMVIYNEKADRNFVQIADMRGNMIKTIPAEEFLEAVAKARAALGLRGGNSGDIIGLFLDVLR